MLSLIYTWLSLPRLDRKGVTALEYAVLAAGIVVAVYTAASALGGDISSLFGTIGGYLSVPAAP